ncbi:hypothetical protein [Microcystis aeruginosa]|jgi:hypothetical protein|nr:hypothetical protein [Microcystis aeruginosa]
MTDCNTIFFGKSMEKSQVKAEIVAEYFWAKENFLFAVRLIF